MFTDMIVGEERQSFPSQNVLLIVPTSYLVHSTIHSFEPEELIWLT
jgi:hypothetical protein